LVGVGLGLTPVEPAPGGQSAVNDAKSGRQGGRVGQRGGQMEGVLTHSLGRFDQAAVGEGPAAGEEDPVLNNHGQQFGEDLTQDAPGLGTTRGIDLAVALPQREEQLDLRCGHAPARGPRAGRATPQGR